MSDLSLKVAVREHVEQRELSSAQLDELEGLLAQTPEHGAAPAIGKRRHWIVLAAAAVVLLAAGLWIASPTTTGTAPTPQRVAAEAAKNHVKLKPLEVTSNDMDAIRAFFSELDFVPADSAALARSDIELMGGRYCSIDGDAAAQLRVRQRSTDRVGSLYMVPYQPDQHGPLPRRDQGEAPLTVHSRGLKVEIWVEQDLLMALAGAN